MPHRRRSWPATIRRLLRDVVTLASLPPRRAQLAVENMLLRKQRALDHERRVKPRRPDPATKVVLVLLSHQLDWRSLLTCSGQTRTWVLHAYCPGRGDGGSRQGDQSLEQLTMDTWARHVQRLRSVATQDCGSTRFRRSLSEAPGETDEYPFVMQRSPRAAPGAFGPRPADWRPVGG